MKKLIIGLLFCIFCTVSPAAPRIKSTGNETCTISPNPTSNGQMLTVSGSGFQPNLYLALSFTGEGGIMSQAVSDDRGQVIFALGPTYFVDLGSWTATIFLDNHKYYFQPDRKATVFTQCSVEVQ